MRAQFLYRPDDNGYGYNVVDTHIGYIDAIDPDGLNNDWKNEECPEHSKSNQWDRVWHYRSTKQDKCVLTLAKENNHKIILDGRDYQKTKVYRAEYPIRHLSTQFKLGDFKAVERYYSKILKDLNLGHESSSVSKAHSDRTMRPFVGRKLIAGESPSVKWQDRTTRWAHAYQANHEIRLPKNSWAWNAIVLLHELAHILSPRWEQHGAIFTRTFIDLVERYESKKLAKKLASNYKRGVQKEKDYWAYNPLTSTGYDARSDRPARKGRKMKIDVAPEQYGLARIEGKPEVTKYPEGWSTFTIKYVDNWQEKLAKFHEEGRGHRQVATA